MSHEKPDIFDFLGKFVLKYAEPQLCKNIELQHLDITINNLPDSFKNFKICHFSDLHNADLFEEKPDIFNKIYQEKPDIFIISGDSTSDNHIDRAVKTISSLKAITESSNIYVITGNHEFFRENYKEKSNTGYFVRKLREQGINVLRDDSKEIKRNGDSIFILGIEDPFGYPDETRYLEEGIEELINKIPKDKVKILISHRPEKIDLYSKYNIDLVFSGHAHGGQIVIPIINRALFAPNQGLFPKYTEGVYNRQKLQEVVSPGLSNEFKFPRYNNPGKIYFVSLH